MGSPHDPFGPPRVIVLRCDKCGSTIVMTVTAGTTNMTRLCRPGCPNRLFMIGPGGVRFNLPAAVMSIAMTWRIDTLEAEMAAMAEAEARTKAGAEAGAQVPGPVVDDADPDPASAADGLWHCGVGKKDAN